ncbi:hypothetical protein [Micromonospora sp. WMMD1155]|uniref:hypothetical protein n=1 Tax=Micromonospora sp. WMMD1155 TaxID=3016094 RepID=UPI00249C9BBB|nr:hypothetical protein [Micromonospora sp. WMMD1155]WFE53169.1 hypothetical protein O7617_23890 [Micromonospora sp. WMMD1155]
MRAIGLLRHGGPDVLEVVGRPTPHAGPGEVRIRVRAAAVNPTDTLIRAGVTPIRQRGNEPVIPAWAWPAPSTRSVPAPTPASPSATG